MYRRRKTLALTLTLALCSICSLQAQLNKPEPSPLDSDHDGLSDQLEASLLAKFSPAFMISHDDCSARPAQFVPGKKIPTVAADDGTIYGQAFPRKGHPGEVELHYYHLWRKDCGEMGHRLDTEHVSALVTLGTNLTAGTSLIDSIATSWYAAAHENTVCDASQITRAGTIQAETHGATVWISQGKHASFLSELLCTHGCGGDRCERMEPLETKQIINLGEPGAPMNSIAWLASPEWPLTDKMQRTNFLPSRIARLQELPITDIAWANPSKRPAQAAILAANTGIGGAATGARATDTALVLANQSTAAALDQTADKAGNALKTSSQNVWNALKKSIHKTIQKTGQILGSTPPK